MVAIPFEYDRSLTYEDLLATPDDGKRYEILQGELVVTPPLDGQHQTSLSRLGIALAHAMRAARLGTSILGPFNVRFTISGIAVRPIS